MQLSGLIQLSSPPATMYIKLPRPRGLWKVARETPQLRLDTTITGPKRPRDDGHRRYSKALCHDREDDHISSDGDCCDTDSSYSSKSKRRRISESPSAEDQQPEEVIFWDYSRNCTPYSERLSRWTTRTKFMDNTSIAGPGRPSPDRSTCNLEDWQDLKQLFAKAVEMYESPSFSYLPVGSTSNFCSSSRAFRDNISSKRCHSRVSPLHESLPRSIYLVCNPSPATRNRICVF